ncbi:MAG TPA: ATPase, T2SS/T4P/T4SS family [Pirellulales bacterium]|jgi:twitching motility protein PilT|nr:ATPase, T2SS/T4P/T4SS family [Pirellulales bacterium]
MVMWSMDELRLPKACEQLIKRPRGLFLVAGPTGSGKSTSLASMINHLNAATAQGSGKTRHVVAELNDLATIEAAVSAAEAGHVVFGMLNTDSAQRTVNRVIDVFPTNQQEQIRTRLSTSLIGVLAQGLLPRVGGGRIAAYELLVVTQAIANLIRENKTFRIGSAIQTGAKYGMIVMDDSLFNLWREGKCGKNEVLVKARLPEELNLRIAKAERGIL